MHMRTFIFGHTVLLTIALLLMRYGLIMQQIHNKPTSLVLFIDTMKSKKGSRPALCPGEFSCTCTREISQITFKSNTTIKHHVSRSS